MIGSSEFIPTELTIKRTLAHLDPYRFGQPEKSDPSENSLQVVFGTTELGSQERCVKEMNDPSLMKHNLVICLENVLFSVNKDVKEKSKFQAVYFSARPGLRAFINGLSEDFNIIILTSYALHVAERVLQRAGVLKKIYQIFCMDYSKPNIIEKDFLTKLDMSKNHTVYLTSEEEIAKLKGLNVLHLRPFDGDCSDSELEKLVLFFRQAVRNGEELFPIKDVALKYEKVIFSFRVSSLHLEESIPSSENNYDIMEETDEDDSPLGDYMSSLSKASTLIDLKQKMNAMRSNKKIPTIEHENSDQILTSRISQLVQPLPGYLRVKVDQK